MGDTGALHGALGGIARGEERSFDETGALVSLQREALERLVVGGTSGREACLVLLLQREALTGFLAAAGISGR